MWSTGSPKVDRAAQGCSPVVSATVTSRVPGTWKDGHKRAASSVLTQGAAQTCPATAGRKGRKVFSFFTHKSYLGTRGAAQRWCLQGPSFHP